MACGGAGDGPSDEPRVGGALVDHNDWVLSSLGAALFGEIPAEVCEEDLSYRAEELGGEFVFAVETEFCSYVTVEQPTRLELRAGDSVKVRFYHAPLTGPPDAMAHIGLALGDQLVWSRDIPIPAGNQFISETLTLTQDLPAGTPVLFHVDNHGDNEYALIKLSLEL